LASVAKRHRCDVAILDCKKERFDYKDFERYIKENHFDLMGFQIFTYDINRVKRHVDLARKYNKEALIIGGGAHPSGDPMGILGYIDNMDFAFKGEGEIGFGRFIEKLMEVGISGIKENFAALKKIPGLIFRDEDGKIVFNEPEYVDNLDALDLPAWELMDPRTYPEAPHGGFARQFPAAPIIITRGCPHFCTFCAGKSVTGPKIRRRTIDNVWGEVEYLTDRFGIKELLIEDENFTLHKRLLTEFCHKVISSKKKISWSFPSGIRLETLNSDNLRLMAEAGCYSLAVGIEFGSQRIHDLTRKRLNIDMIREKVALLAKTNIKTTGFFLFGIPDETKADMQNTVRLALELDIDRAQFNNFMPLPGSELWDYLVQTNKLGDVNWDKFFVHDVAYVPEDISKEEIKNIQRAAYIKFYFRPKIMYSLLKEIRSLRHLQMLFGRFIDALS
jgi:radical SAM superfamily enzyme YgiQ (UPF0313 family)